MGQVEGIADPKARLHQALRDASEAKGRRAKRFRPGAAAHRLATLIDDWSPLKRLTAFQKLERDTRATLDSLSAA